MQTFMTVSENSNSVFHKEVIKCDTDSYLEMCKEL